MKQNSKIVIGILLIISLSGCFGFFDKEKKPAAEYVNDSLPPPASSPPPSSSGPPSFDDGSLYLKALAENDTKLCLQLKDVKLQERCKKETVK